MAIELITGLPGNAKTLLALERVIKRSSSENRPVYYAGVNGLVQDDPRLLGIPWTEFDALKWHEVVPTGAIIFIDEGQQIFRSRSMGAVPPKHVTELETHRHKGLDFVITTQHPSLVDPAIRKLTQVHIHMVRISGFQMSTMHMWSSGVRDNCDKPGGRKDSEKTKWAFNKSLYGVYKSADVHTMKAKIPGRAKFLAALVVVFGLMIWWMVGFMAKKTGAAESAQVASSSSSSTPNPFTPGQVQPVGSVHAAFDPVQDARRYVQQETPRVVGLVHTAPKYDEITKPTRAPVPAACIQIGSLSSGKTPGCKCYSQSGTPMPVEYNMCISIANNGYFLDFNPEGGGGRALEGQQGAAAAPGRDVVASVAPSQVLSFAHVPEPSRVTGRPAR